MAWCARGTAWSRVTGGWTAGTGSAPSTCRIPSLQHLTGGMFPDPRACASLPSGALTACQPDEGGGAGHVLEGRGRLLIQPFCKVLTASPFCTPFASPEPSLQLLSGVWGAQLPGGQRPSSGDVSEPEPALRAAGTPGSLLASRRHLGSALFWTLGSPAEFSRTWLLPCSGSQPSACIHAHPGPAASTGGSLLAQRLGFGGPESLLCKKQSPGWLRPGPGLEKMVSGLCSLCEGPV